MAKAARKREMVRLSLDVSPELNALLEDLAHETHSTKSEVLRKAIALINIAVDAKENGQRLYVSAEPPPGQAREIVGI